MNNAKDGSAMAASQAKRREAPAARKAKETVREESGHPSAPAAAPKDRTAKSRAAGREKVPAIDFPSFRAWKCDRDDVDDRGRFHVPSRVCAGAFVFLHQNTKNLRANLRKHFPHHCEDL